MMNKSTFLRLMYLLVVAGIIGTFLVSCDQQKPKALKDRTPGTETWRSDWNAFVSELSRVVQTTESGPAKPESKDSIPAFTINAKADKSTLQGQLFETFAGTVHWRGKVYEYSRRKLGVTVSESDITLPKGFTIPRIVWIKFESDPVREIIRGEEIAFKAILKRPSDDYPFSGILLIGDSITVQLIKGQLE